ncbi:unnamed protein product, partial [Heterotrigona itama]
TTEVSGFARLDEAPETPPKYSPKQRHTRGVSGLQIERITMQVTIALARNASTKKKHPAFHVN